MKLRITEEIGTGAKLWYTIYADNTYVDAYTDRDEAEKAFETVKKLIKQGKTISPQTIKEEQI